MLHCFLCFLFFNLYVCVWAVLVGREEFFPVLSKSLIVPDGIQHRLGPIMELGLPSELTFFFS